MHIKRGSLISINKGKKPLLQTPEGQKYEVSFIAAYVWDLLDGSRGVLDIVEAIEKSGNLKDDDLPQIVNKIIDELEKVNLVGPAQNKNEKHNS